MEPQTEKEWKTPELIVLVRSKPEEAVLGVCKWDADGPGAEFSSCYGYGCMPLCDAMAPS